MAFDGFPDKFWPHIGLPSCDLLLVTKNTGMRAAIMGNEYGNDICSHFCLVIAKTGWQAIQFFAFIYSF